MADSTLPFGSTISVNVDTLPNTPSSDYDAMYSYWVMVESIINGTEAMRRAGRKFLPQFPNEEKNDYEYRLSNSVFTNIYSDIVNNLAAKPFAEETTLQDPVSPQYETLAEDIDGRGNSLNVFAQECFFWGINNAIDWILVDYPDVSGRFTESRPMTRFDEKNLGLRPYWIRIPATRVIAAYTDVVDGKEIFTHVRLLESRKQRIGFNEVIIERIRIFDREQLVDDMGQTTGYLPATFQVWEKRVIGQGGAFASPNSQVQWQLIKEGNISIGIIPIVPFITGKRIEGSWQFIPPMRDCAFAQIEHYQSETGLKSIKELTAFPMLAGNGVNPPKDGAVSVGPRAVLYAPPFGEGRTHGQWQFIEPNGTSLKFLADEVNRIESQMRELGRQPLTAQSGNLTVVTTAFAAQKGNSAVQAWALNLKDALEQAWYMTALWMGQDSQNSPEVRVYTDFALETGEDQTPAQLLQMRASGDLSQSSLWEEMRRRNALRPDFDPVKERQLLDKEKQQQIQDSQDAAARDIQNTVSMNEANAKFDKTVTPNPKQPSSTGPKKPASKG